MSAKIARSRLTLTITCHKYALWRSSIVFVQLSSIQFFILSSQIASFYAKISLSSTSCTTMEASSTSTNRGDDALMPPEATKRFFWYNLSFHVKTFGWSAKKWNDDTCTYKLYISWEKNWRKTFGKIKKKYSTLFSQKKSGEFLFKCHSLIWNVNKVSRILQN